MIEQIYHCQILQARGVQLTKPIEELFEPSRTFAPIQEGQLPEVLESGIEHYQYMRGYISMCWSLPLGERCLRFAVIRNPIERVLAMYNLWRYAYCLNPTIYPAHTGPGFAGTNDFGKFIRSPFFNVDLEHTQARQVLGMYHSFGTGAYIQREDFEPRLRRSHIHLWTTEHRAQAADELNNRLGREVFAPEGAEPGLDAIEQHVMKLELSTNFIREADIDPKDRKVLDQLVRLDAELFEYVREQESESKWSVPAILLNEHTAEEVTDQSADASEQETLLAA